MNSSQLKASLRFLVLVCTLAVPAISYSVPIIDAKQLTAVFSEFLDTTKNPKKTLAQFAENLINLLDNKPQYAKFCLALRSLKTCKNPTKVGAILLQYQGLLPQEIKMLIMAKKSQLPEILKKRVAA